VIIMGWVQHGEIWSDDGEPGGDVQVGKAASIRFVDPDFPGRRVTVYAYPYAPEKAIVTVNGSIETFHGYTSDMNGFRIQAQAWFEADDHAAGDADDFNPNDSVPVRADRNLLGTG
jgi:hypothetical protein